MGFIYGCPIALILALADRLFGDLTFQTEYILSTQRRQSTKPFPLEKSQRISHYQKPMYRNVKRFTEALIIGDYKHQTTLFSLGNHRFYPAVLAHFLEFRLDAGLKFM
jgi:hypothetical protein